MFNSLSSVPSVICTVLAVLLLAWVAWMGMGIAKDNPTGFCFWRQTVTFGFIPCELDPADF